MNLGHSTCHDSGRWWLPHFSFLPPIFHLLTVLGKILNTSKYFFYKRHEWRITMIIIVNHPYSVPGVCSRRIFIEMSNRPTVISQTKYCWRILRSNFKFTRSWVSVVIPGIYDCLVSEINPSETVLVSSHTVFDPCYVFYTPSLWYLLWPTLVTLHKVGLSGTPWIKSVPYSPLSTTRFLGPTPRMVVVELLTGSLHLQFQNPQKESSKDFHFPFSGPKSHLYNILISFEWNPNLSPCCQNCRWK